AHIGISRMVKASGRDALMAATLEALTSAGAQTLVVTNFVDFDTLYGHRRDIQGYADELESFDQLLPQLLAALQPGDLLVLSADHGCDPAWPGTDHTRERVPLLVAGPGVRPQRLGVRASMADIGATLSDHLQLAPTGVGQSFYAELYP
ncbi:MAG: phosphopentomutase, partial [Corallincola sp.]|nr:phosphopentomutase [Corallincola sp.]